MPDDNYDGPYTSAQLSDGTVLKFKGDLDPITVKSKVATYRAGATQANTQAAGEVKSIVQPQTVADPTGLAAGLDTAKRMESVVGAASSMAPVMSTPMGVIKGAAGALAGGLAGTEGARLLHLPGWAQAGAGIAGGVVGGGIGAGIGEGGAARPIVRGMLSRVAGKEAGLRTFPLTDAEMAAQQVKTAMPMGERIAGLKSWAPKPVPEPPMDPLAGGTPTNRISTGGATLPSPSLSNTTSTGPNIGPLPQPPPAQSLSSNLGGSGSKIVDQFSKPAPVEGSYWSYNKADLEKAVMHGDRDAATVYRNRFHDLPPEAGLLTDVGSQPVRGQYRSKK